ncbi:hypothetical protein [Zhihengliuella flava]|uniref:Uncharacterized protein n=1 Tax=Zhihengliuella flava TaxID=1285193 RepID=A0A931GHI6_9MICC|nr:hypothetical protein [Zhihengliuella flava]MBG6083286.1 hypothetical protein [Zhihengliuella flava]
MMDATLWQVVVAALGVVVSVLVAAWVASYQYRTTVLHQVRRDVADALQQIAAFQLTAFKLIHEPDKRTLQMTLDELAEVDSDIVGLLERLRFEAEAVGRSLTTIELSAPAIVVAQAAAMRSTVNVIEGRIADWLRLYRDGLYSYKLVEVDGSLTREVLEMGDARTRLFVSALEAKPRGIGWSQNRRRKASSPEQ